MPGLVPGIHVLLQNKRKSWMAGSSCAKTRFALLPGHDDVALSVRGALWRRGRPRLDQRVVVDGFALRLLVRQFALGRDGAVLLGLLEPEFGRLLLVELRSAGTLHTGLLK